MSYHRFSNLGEKFSSDLNNKLMQGIIDLELPERKCNCNKNTLTKKSIKKVKFVSAVYLTANADQVWLFIVLLTKNC